MNFEDIRKKIEESKKQKKEQQEEQLRIDPKTVDKIVSEMKKKYREEGRAQEPAKESIYELRGMVSGTESVKVSTQPVEELIEIKSPLVSTLGRIFLSTRLLLEPLISGVKRFPISKELAFYLYSANVNYSARQYLALSVTIAGLAFVVSTAIGIVASIALKFDIALAFAIGIGMFFLTLIMVLMIPKSIAQKRGKEISRELPFALRHMSTELRAGISLYKTLETIASSNYGLLSVEFARTINEIEEGTGTEEALRHFALRTQSKSLRNALFHIIRALKTGGKLSNVMNEIAEDVSFDLQLSIRDFAEKMNFFGVIFIFGAIVIPVFIAIIGTILNAPLGLPIASVSMPPSIILALYTMIFPGILGFLIYYIKSIQPSV
ncbi:MAG: type II secretion system F family protein [Candidatus Diapherotrites archaeon]|nr:type II secretion system F family protein [Candidatus Diapherotrites archaeon]